MKKAGYVVVALLGLVVGALLGGYFMSGGRASLVSQANAGGCVSITWQGEPTGLILPGFSCAYVIRFDKNIGIMTKSTSNEITLYFN